MHDMEYKHSFRLDNHNISLRDGHTHATAYTVEPVIRGKKGHLDFPQIKYAIDATTPPSLPVDIEKFIRDEHFIPYPLQAILDTWFSMDISGQLSNAIIVFPVYASAPRFRFEGDELHAKYVVHPSLESKSREKILLSESGKPISTMKPEDGISFSAESGLNWNESIFPRTDDMTVGRQIEFILKNKLGTLVDEGIQISELLPKPTEPRSEPNSYASTLDKLISFQTIKSRIDEGGLFFGKPLDAAPDFVRFASLTFSLLGLQVLETDGLEFVTFRYPDKSDIGDMDLIVFDPQTNKTFMFQCTLTSPKDDKMDRVLNIREQLISRQIPVEVVVLVKSRATQNKRSSEIRIIDKEDWLRTWEKILAMDYQGARTVLQIN